jgi:hypothetical protein
MLLNKEKILKNPRLCQSIFGTSREEIERLLLVFGQCIITYRYQLKPKENRKRKIGAGRKGDLPTDLDKLLYILMYLKIYPTYDVLSILSNHQRSKCGDSVNFLLPVLEMTLKRKLVLPKRKAASLKEVFKRCPGLKDVFMDGTERRTQKPKNLKKRKKLYSGKKKSTTRKTVVVSDDKNRIILMTPTKNGRRHDKKISDKNGIIEAIPQEITIWTDTGFTGIQHKHPKSMIPDKRRKNHPLTKEQEENNKIISGIRVLSEHAIGGLKRFKAASDTYRNHRPNMDDLMNRICGGLWNLHLDQTV